MIGKKILFLLVAMFMLALVACGGQVQQAAEKRLRLPPRPWKQR